MNARRIGLVDKAFAVLDRTGDGVVDVDDVVEAFDATRHPEVVAGAKTSDDVFREFLDTFEVGGEKDGHVSKAEFRNYYANVSASVDDDDYFELMIRMARRLLTRSSTRVEKRSIGAASRRLSRNQRNRS